MVILPNEIPKVVIGGDNEGFWSSISWESVGFRTSKQCDYLGYYLIERDKNGQSIKFYDFFIGLV